MVMQIGSSVSVILIYIREGQRPKVAAKQQLGNLPPRLGGHFRTMGAWDVNVKVRFILACTCHKRRQKKDGNIGKGDFSEDTAGPARLRTAILDVKLAARTENPRQKQRSYPESDKTQKKSEFSGVCVA